MRISRKLYCVLVLASFALLLVFTTTNAANMTLIAEIPITAQPANSGIGYLGGAAWTITPNPAPPPPLLTNASFDLLSFDPVRQIMYSADRPNHGVDVINTQTNTLVGFIPVIDPSATGANKTCVNGLGSCPSGVQVAPDLRQLIVTDRGASPSGGVYIYDLTASAAPQVPTKVVQLPNARGTDELNYDPLNKRVYVNNTTNTGDSLGRYFMSVIDVNPASATYGQLLGQIPIASGANSPEQPRFDPLDCTATPGTGCIYTTTGGNSTLLRINPNFALNATDPSQNVGAIIKTIQLPGCSPAGFDVNTAGNTGLLGCNPGAPNGFPQELINLTTDTIIGQIPGITATDVLAFDPHLNEWFTASQNLLVSNGCPASQANAAQFPQVGGIFENPNPGLQVACSGQGAHGIGVDTTNDRLYVPVGIFPSNGASSPACPNLTQSTPCTGILVFQAQAVPEPSSLLLLGFGLAGFFIQLKRLRT